MSDDSRREQDDASRAVAARFAHRATAGGPRASLLGVMPVLHTPATSSVADWALMNAAMTLAAHRPSRKRSSGDRASGHTREREPTARER